MDSSFFLIPTQATFLALFAFLPPHSLSVRMLNSSVMSDSLQPHGM